ncbi:MAG: MFS transporter, partial [Alphaproteobacteria bacterium]|nr:MFS transporter [Alphaproteobacteria bacterium]
MAKKELDKSVKRGLTLLKMGWFCHNFMLIIPVIVLVYTSKGITVGDFFLIQGIFRLAAFLFEIPSGYMSDCLSRRRVMIAGGVSTIAGYVSIALASGFWTLIMGEALLGIASALFSGTLEAYTYDLLKRNKTQKQFLKEFGNITTWAGVAEFVAMIIGGILYGYIGANILWIETVIMLFGTVAFLFLPELLEVKRVVKHKDAITDAVSITANTLKNPRLRNLILFPSLYGTFTIIMFWILQPIMDTVKIPVGLFGVYAGASQLFRIILSKYAYKICEKLGEIRTSM